MNFSTNLIMLEGEFDTACVVLRRAQAAFARSRSRKNAIALESAQLAHAAAADALLAARELSQRDADRKERAMKRAADIQRRAELDAAQLSLF